MSTTPSLTIDTTAHRCWPAADRRLLVVGIAGGSASGKTAIAQALARDLGDEQASLLQHDHYYRDLRHLSAAARETNNYDHPSALETTLLVAHVDQLRAGAPIWRPAYNFGNQTRTPEAVCIAPRPILLLEGIMVLQDEALRSRMDLRVFVDAPEAVRLERRVARDQQERGYSEDQIRRQFAATVKPMHDRFVEPSRAHADMVIPNGYNPAAVGLLLHALRALCPTLPER